MAVRRLWVSALAVLLLAASAPAAEPPALVVVVSVDQFATEYLTRFDKHFRPGGFKRLMDSGAFFVEARHRHAATATGPGHATISTGAWAGRHGIIGNGWFDPKAGADVYCVEDREFPEIPAVPGKRDRTKPVTGRSPRNLLANTLGDQLKIATQGKARVVSVALKDRSAILMGGHAADEVYWYDTGTGAFITSFYYRSDLADWVRHFNGLPYLERTGLKVESGDPAAEEDDADAPKDKKPAGKKDAKKEPKGPVWRTLLPEDAYKHLPENNPKMSVGDLGLKFPHKLPAKDGDLFKAVYGTPFGNNLVLNLAMAAIDNERLGKGPVTDLLCIGFSSNDSVGHMFGPHSREVMDTVLRTDVQIETLLNFLDARVGKGRYIVALTSDHGVTPIHNEARLAGAPTYRTVPAKIREAGERALVAAFGAAERPYIRGSGGGAIYLDWDLLAARKIDRPQAERILADAVLRQPGVVAVHTRSELSLLPAGAEAGDEIPVLLARDFHPVRSGDVFVVTPPFSSSGTAPTGEKPEREKPEERPLGAGHGSPYEEDQRVPILLYGAWIAPGKHRRRVGVPDLAPTLAELMGISRPSACQGRPLEEVLGK